MTTFPHLDEAQVRELITDYATCIGLLRRAYVARGGGRTSVAPKLAVPGVEKGFFHAMPAVYEDTVVVKWVASGAAPRGAYIHALLVASNRVTGETIATMDFAWPTAVRTASISALGVDLLARPGVGTMAISGLGLQARTHLDAILAVRDIRKVVALGRTPDSLER